MQDEVGEDGIGQQVGHLGRGEGLVEGPQAGADEVEEGPGGQCQPSCQAHGLQQLLQTTQAGYRPPIMNANRWR